jgi:hypothetical protein
VTDMMALSSMELTQFKRIGSHTNGAISDALQKNYQTVGTLTFKRNLQIKNDKYYENIDSRL